MPPGKEPPAGTVGWKRLGMMRDRCYAAGITPLVTHMCKHISLTYECWEMSEVQSEVFKELASKAA